MGLTKVAVEFSSIFILCFLSSLPRIQGAESDVISVPLTEQDCYFYANVRIGNQLQSLFNRLKGKFKFSQSNQEPFRMLLDTSFTGIVVFSKKACEALKLKKNKKNHQNSIDMCNNINKYDDSMPDEKKNEKFEILTYQGRISGFLYSDTVKIEGYEFSEQRIGIATTWEEDSLSKNGKTGHFDGIFGIQLLETGGKQSVESSLFGTLQKKNFIKSIQYGLYLNYPDHRGELTIGGVNKTYVQGQFNSIGIGNNGWRVNIDRIQVGETTIGENLVAFVSPSFNHLFGKADLIGKINKEIKANLNEEVYLFSSCDLNENPDVKFVINGQTYTLTSQYYHFKYKGTLLQTFTLCLSHFVTSEANDFDFLLGSPFLAKYYSSFNTDQKTLSFADAISPVK